MAEFGIKTQLPAPDPTVDIVPQLREALRLGFNPPTGNAPADTQAMERINVFLNRFGSNRSIDETSRTGTLSPTGPGARATKDMVSGENLLGTFPKPTLEQQNLKQIQATLPQNADPTLITVQNPSPTGGPPITGRIVAKFPDGTMDVQFGTDVTGVAALVFRMDAQGNFVGIKEQDKPGSTTLSDSPSVRGASQQGMKETATGF